MANLKKILLNRYVWIIVYIALLLGLKTVVSKAFDIAPLDDGDELPPEDDETYWF